MFNDGKKDRYWICSRYITFAHVARLILFVPSEAAIHPPVALQFRSDARRVLAVEFVIEASWNDEWTFEKLIFFSLFLFFFSFPLKRYHWILKKRTRRKNDYGRSFVVIRYPNFIVINVENFSIHCSFAISRCEDRWTKIQLRYKKIFERISHRTRGQVTRKILVLAGVAGAKREPDTCICTRCSICHSTAALPPLISKIESFHARLFFLSPPPDTNQLNRINSFSSISL